MTLFISIIAVIIILGILSAAHELGHFFVSKFFGVKVYEVSVFVGPTLLKWNRKGVDYSIRCIPIGAYVRYSEINDKGEPVENDEDKELLVNQPRWRRLLIALAGPIVNLLLGVIIFALFYSIGGYTSLKIGPIYEDTQLYKHIDVVSPGDEIVKIDGSRVYTDSDLMIYYDLKDPMDTTILTLRSASSGDLYDVTLVPTVREQVMFGITVLSDVNPEYGGWDIVEVSPTQNDNNPILKPGDILLGVDDVTVKSGEINDYMLSLSDGVVAEVSYIRDGVEKKESIVLHTQERIDSAGIILTRVEIDSFGSFIGALEHSIEMPLSIFKMTGVVIDNALRGKVEAYNVVSGPVGVVNAVDSVVSDESVTASIKLNTLVMLSGLISVALTITNLLPLPGLDGSQLILLIVEMIIGKKLSKRAENVITVIGVCVLILLVILAFASDIARIILEGW